MRIGAGRLVVAEGAGEQPHHRIEDTQRRRLSARQHEVSEGDFLGGQMVRHALVDILVVAAEQRQFLPERPAHRVIVGKTPAACREQHHRPGRRTERLHRLEKRLRLEHHPGPAAEGVRFPLPFVPDSADTNAARFIERFLADGDKVKATIFFRGRENAHPEIGRRILERLLAELSQEAVAENMPQKEGNTMHVILAKRTSGGPKHPAAPRPAPRPAAVAADVASVVDDAPVIEDLAMIDDVAVIDDVPADADANPESEQTTGE
jgi:hypothetical protein